MRSAKKRMQDLPIAPCIGAALGILAIAGPGWGQWVNCTSGSQQCTSNANPVGIGTTAPDQKLTVQGGVAIRDSSGANAGQTLYVANTTASGTNYGEVIYAVGSGSSYNTAGYFAAWGAGTNNIGVRIVDPSAGPGDYGIYVDATAQNYFAGNVGIGTASPQAKLEVAGEILAQEVVVSASALPDYVFEPGYRNAPLAEVAKYIEANHHLPGMPSAAEAEKNGLGVGDMQKKLLEKVEELTLHMITAESENRELRERLAAIERSLAK